MAQPQVTIDHGEQMRFHTLRAYLESLPAYDPFMPVFVNGSPLTRIMIVDNKLELLTK